MSDRYATPLRLEFRQPRGWFPALVLLQLLALVLLWRLPLSWPWLAALLVLWSLAARQSLRAGGTRRLVRAIWLEQDAWHLWFADGRASTARLSPRYFLRGPLLQLTLRLEQGRALPLTILPGMLPRETLRRLKVRLRLFAGS